jgi:addiction module RelE/StbE family toxin
MKVTFHRSFKKTLQKRFGSNPKIITRFHQRLGQFIDNSNDFQLRNHRLAGKMNQYWSFSVTGDIRVIYEKMSDDEIFIFDIGSHNQVY